MYIDFLNMDIQKAVKQGVKSALIGLGNIAVTQARVDVPVDTGRLRNSIVWKTKDSESQVGKGGEIPTSEQIIKAPNNENLLVFGTNVEYAAVVEYGDPDKKRKPKPFIAPARLKVEKEIKKGYVAKKIMQAIKKAGL